MRAKKETATKKPVTRVISRGAGKAKSGPAKKAVAAKKMAMQKPVAKKATAKKPVVKKATVKKATVKKATVKKATVKKATVKKTVSKKAVAKKAASAKVTAEKAHVLSRVKSRSKVLGSAPAPKPTASPKAAGKAKKLSKKDQKAFTSLLLAQREQLVQQALTLKDESLQHHEDIITSEDGTDVFDRQFALTLASSELEEVHDIDDALRRLDEGNYGICEECGCEIEKPRLTALPFVRLCITCQSERERHRRHFRPVM